MWEVSNTKLITRRADYHESWALGTLADSTVKDKPTWKRDLFVLENIPQHFSMFFGLSLKQEGNKL